MKVEIVPSSPGTVEVVLGDQPSNLPQSLSIAPGADGPKIRTNPAGHFFDEHDGRLSSARELVETARDYLAGTLDDQTARDGFTRALGAWSRVEEQTTGGAGMQAAEETKQR